MTKLAAAIVIVMLAASQAQTPAPAPARPVPVAANTLASRPDAFYGQVVSLTATVDRTLSSSAFVIDQDKTKSTPEEVLVIVPVLNGRLDPGTSVTVVGEFLRFDAAEVARRLKDYKLDVGADGLARYEGRPVIIATAVVNAALFDFAKRVPPPMTPEEEAFDKVMKRIGPAFNTLRTAAGAADAKAAAESSKVLRDAFAEADTFWKARAAANAIDWNRTARAHLTVLDRAIAAANWDQVKTSIADVNGMCSSCHAAHRERFEDGTYRVKAAPAR